MDALWGGRFVSEAAGTSRLAGPAARLGDHQIVERLSPHDASVAAPADPAAGR